MKIFTRNKESSDPTVIIDKCFKSIVNRISDAFEEDNYYWNKPWGIKRFESMVLAKFMLDYSFNMIAEDKLKEDEFVSYNNFARESILNLFNNEFSSIGLNYEDMEEEIQMKVDSYSSARKESKPPFCWHAIYELITKSKSKEIIDEEIKSKIAGLELIKRNENFISMVPQYELQINILKGKSNAFELAEMMIPHMIRFSKEKLRTIKLKKIKALSKKIAKEQKCKKK